MNSGATSRTTDQAWSRAAFTLIELLVAILVIFLLIGLLIVGMRHAIAFAKGTGDGAAVHALKQGATQFENEFHFSVPLVKDAIPAIFPPATGGPIDQTKGAPKVYSLATTPSGPGSDIDRLNTWIRVGVIDVNPTQPPQPANNTTTGSPGTTDPRFSVYSLSYYLYGTLGKAEATPGNPVPIDGVDGPGFCTPKRDGSFEKQGRKFTPFYDPRRADAVFEQTPAGQGRIELRDSHHIAFRYYRWVGDKGMPNPPAPILNPTIAQLKIPEMVGDPQARPEIRSASWAIVAAGPNGLFGDEDLLPSIHPQHRTFDEMVGVLGLSGASGDPAFVDKVRKAAAADNIVEVGQ